LGVSGTDIPIQQASKPSIPKEVEGLGHSALGIGRLHLAKKALFGCARWKLGKVRASKTGTRDNHQPETVSIPKKGETSTETP
jgi:hypothetical protein